MLRNNPNNIYDILTIQTKFNENKHINLDFLKIQHNNVYLFAKKCLKMLDKKKRS